MSTKRTISAVLAVTITETNDDEPSSVRQRFSMADLAADESALIEAYNTQRPEGWPDWHELPSPMRREFLAMALRSFRGKPVAKCGAQRLLPRAAGGNGK